MKRTGQKEPAVSRNVLAEETSSLSVSPSVPHSLVHTHAHTENYVPLDIQWNSPEIQADIKLIPSPSTKMGPWNKTVKSSHQTKDKIHFLMVGFSLFRCQMGKAPRMGQYNTKQVKSFYCFIHLGLLNQYPIFLVNHVLITINGSTWEMVVLSSFWHSSMRLSFYPLNAPERTSKHSLNSLSKAFLVKSLVSPKRQMCQIQKPQGIKWSTRGIIKQCLKPPTPFLVSTEGLRAAIFCNFLKPTIPQACLLHTTIGCVWKWENFTSLLSFLSSSHRCFHHVSHAQTPAMPSRWDWLCTVIIIWIPILPLSMMCAGVYLFPLLNVATWNCFCIQIWSDIFLQSGSF